METVGQKVISYAKIVKNKEDDLIEDIPIKVESDAKTVGAEVMENVQENDLVDDDADFKTVTSKKDRSEKLKEKPERRRRRRAGRNRDKDSTSREQESPRETKENSIEKEGEEIGEEEKVTYVEAPLPKTNPWKKGKKCEEMEKKDVAEVLDANPPLELSKQKKNILKEKKEGKH